jgi:hypothetical protein
MENYPASLDIDYSDTSNRLTAFFRIILAIPIWIILGLLTTNFVDTNNGEAFEHYQYVGIVFLPTLLMILFRKKYPRWWFDWNLALTKFSTRVASYVLLLRDEYPSTDEEQAVHIDIPYPDVEKELNRWMPLIKWLLVIPHIIVLIFLFVIVLLFTVFAWLIILLTGNYPKSMFDFVVGVMRWSLRVYAYAALLTTDKYPPFTLSQWL